MTVSSGHQLARKQNAFNDAKNTITNSYENDKLNTDFANWWDSGGYAKMNPTNNFGVHKSGGKFNQAGMKDDIINKFTDYNKRNLQNYMDSNFADLGTSNLWLNNYWTNSSDDDLVNNFINTNYDNTLSQLDRALKRGTLSQKGYDSALNDLNKQKSAAYTTVGGIGQGIIDGYKTALTEKAQGYGQNIDKFNLGNYGQFNVNDFQTDFQDTYNNQLANFENDFNLMTQDYTPFDVSGIIGDARVAQGVNNTQTDPLLSAIEDTEKKKDQKVGLGNKGLF